MSAMTRKFVNKTSAMVLAAALVGAGGSAAVGQLATEQGPSTGAVSQVGAPAQSIELTPEELREWAQITATPEGRASLVQGLQESFDGVAEVGTDSPAGPSGGVVRSVVYAAGPQVEIDAVLAYGKNSNHVWITASYADMARGAIWTAVGYCKTRVPAWVCTRAGQTLDSWARGWGSANNHGVWAAVYWSPPRWEGGRW
ncbi:MAG: hypothetical protein ACT4QF_20590 [Sporichthyaceae bacterium]